MKNPILRNAFRTFLRPSPCALIPSSDHDIDEPPWDKHHFLDQLPAHELLHARIGKHQRFDCLAVSVARHPNVAALLAVHLHDELDLVFDQSVRVVLRPRRIEYVLAVAEIAPQLMAHVWRDRREQTQEYVEAFVDYAIAQR